MDNTETPAQALPSITNAHSLHSCPLQSEYMTPSGARSFPCEMATHVLMNTAPNSAPETMRDS